MIIQGEDYRLKIGKRELAKFIKNPKPICDEIISIFQQGGTGCQVISSDNVLWHYSHLDDVKGNERVHIWFPIGWSDEDQEKDIIMPIVDKYLRTDMEKMFGEKWEIYCYDSYDVPSRFFKYMNNLQM